MKEGICLLDQLGIKKVTLDLPFRLNHVNCFIGETDHGVKVMDTGLHRNQTVQRWNEELEGKHVSDIIITHYHPDHFGYAGGLQQQTGANVWMTEIDERAALSSWEKTFLQQLKDNYKLAGIPKEIATQLADNTSSFYSYVTPYPSVHRHLREGEQIQFGTYEYEIIYTPGHSDGLVTFYNHEKNVLLSTDHILPKITPNISYWFHGEENPLNNYLASLEKIEKLQVEWVIPSHGNPFLDANKRIEEIKAHHEDRLSYLLEEIKVETTVYEATEKLFPKKLSVHDSRFAVGETIAHLEYLRIAGECNKELINGVYRYKVN